MSDSHSSKSDAADLARALYERYLELPVIAQAIKSLESDLSERFYFHSSAHTKNVLHEVVRFALHDQLPERDITLLAIAAAYHDTGFLERPFDNEVIGAANARSALQADGAFSGKEIALVEAMILDTRLVETSDGPRQVATTDLSGYLLDADLSNLGRDDFFDCAELLRQELGVEKRLFFRQAHKLLKNHEWLTQAARSMRENGQRKNLVKLLALMKDLEGSGSHQPLSEEEESAVDQYGSVSLDRLLFLGKLPLLLNSSLDTSRITQIAIDHVKSMLNAEACTVFLLDPEAQQLTFWSLMGGEKKLSGMKMPADKGIVGWAIQKQETVHIPDAKNDPRFFSQIDKEGSFQTRNLICVPLVSAGRRPLGALQVLNKRGGQDFTQGDVHFFEQFAHQLTLALENARMYEQSQVERQKLETLTRRKAETMTVIAHEFRTPLNIIQTSVEMLSSGILDKAGQDKMSETLQRGVRRLTKLIAEIQNLSIVSRDSFELNLENVDPRRLFDKVVADLAEPLKERKLSLSHQVESDVEAVHCDESLIVIALRNLISNAIRFTSDGGKISLHARSEAGFVVIEVQDSGIGIAKDQQDLIFDMFYEVGDAMGHSSGEYEFKSGGLGIGLTTSRAILMAHGSTIEVKSAPGKGSTFTLRLPAIH